MITLKKVLSILLVLGVKAKMRGIFLDTETNGLNWRHNHILEIALKVLDLSSGELLCSYTSKIYLSKEEWAKSNLESLAFNGITREEIEKAPKREVVKAALLDLFKKYDLKRGSAVFICQNPAFDRVFLSNLIEVELQEENRFPYTWLDLASMFWAKQLTNKGNPNEIQLSKDKIAHFYDIPEEKKPHRAEGGVDHLIECYKKVVGFPLKNVVHNQ